MTPEFTTLERQTMRTPPEGGGKHVEPGFDFPDSKLPSDEPLFPSSRFSNWPLGRRSTTSLNPP